METITRAGELLAKDQLIDVGGGDVVAVVGAHPELYRDDGTPARDGDVLSVQPDGVFQTRPSGADGPFERAKISGAVLVYRPVAGGRAFFVGLATAWPNPE